MTNSDDVWLEATEKPSLCVEGRHYVNHNNEILEVFALWREIVYLDDSFEDFTHD